MQIAACSAPPRLDAVAIRYNYCAKHHRARYRVILTQDGSIRGDALFSSRRCRDGWVAWWRKQAGDLFTRIEQDTAFH